MINKNLLVTWVIPDEETKNLFLNYHIPSLLAEGNLEELKNFKSVRFMVVSTSKVFPRLERHILSIKLRRFGIFIWGPLAEDKATRIAYKRNAIPYAVVANWSFVNGGLLLTPHPNSIMAEGAFTKIVEFAKENPNGQYYQTAPRLQLESLLEDELLVKNEEQWTKKVLRYHKRDLFGLLRLYSHFENPFGGIGCSDEKFKMDGTIYWRVPNSGIFLLCFDKQPLMIPINMIAVDLLHGFNRMGPWEFHNYDLDCWNLDGDDFPCVQLVPGEWKAKPSEEVKKEKITKIAEWISNGFLCGHGQEILGLHPVWFQWKEKLDGVEEELKKQGLEIIEKFVGNIVQRAIGLNSSMYANYIPTRKEG